VHKRPWAKDTQREVVAAGAFLTVNEYVSAVYPWLIAMRDALLEALGKMVGDPPWPPETKLAVLWLEPGPLRIEREDRWAWWHQKPPAVHRSMAVGDPLSEEQGERKFMERIRAITAARIRARGRRQHREAAASEATPLLSMKQWATKYLMEDLPFHNGFPIPRYS
jgi:hypothetical protein